MNEAEDEVARRLQIGRSVSSSLSQIPGVIAVVQGGSATTGHADALSDIDLYVYANTALDPGERRLVIEEEDGLRAAFLDHHWYEPGDIWTARQGTLVDVMYRTCAWLERELDMRLIENSPNLGFTTAILFNVQNSVTHYDPEQWFAAARKRVMKPYPEALARAIIAANLPLLREVPFSFRHQLEVALIRHDNVAIIQIIDRFLASYFDILFALNRRWHPGEKRLITLAGQLSTIPVGMDDDLRELIATVPIPSRPQRLLRCVDRMSAAIAECVSFN